MAKDEAKGLSRYLFELLGFPAGLLALLGAFAVGMAIYKDEVSMGNKRFTLGMTLLSLAILTYCLPRIYARASIYYLGEKIPRYFSLGALLWTIAGGIGCYFFVPAFVSLMRQ